MENTNDHPGAAINSVRTAAKKAPSTRKQRSALVSRVVARSYDWGVYRGETDAFKEEHRAAIRWLVDAGHTFTNARGQSFAHGIMCQAMAIISGDTTDTEMLEAWRAR